MLTMMVTTMQSVEDAMFSRGRIIRNTNGVHELLICNRERIKVVFGSASWAYKSAKSLTYAKEVYKLYDQGGELILDYDAYRKGFA